MGGGCISSGRGAFFCWTGKQQVWGGRRIRRAGRRAAGTVAGTHAQGSAREPPLSPPPGHCAAGCPAGLRGGKGLGPSNSCSAVHVSSQRFVGQRGQKQFSQFLGLSFSFCLTKTGHPSVPPAYSYTHRYNKISLNIKEKNTKIHGINVHFKPRLKYPHDDNNDNNYTDNNHNN